MRQDDLLQMLRQRPFQPFRFFILETTTFEIRHPEMVSVGRSALTFPASLNPAEEGDVWVALVHITRIETLPRPASPPPNGA